MTTEREKKNILSEKLENVFTPPYVDGDLHNGMAHYHLVRISFVVDWVAEVAVKLVVS